MATLAPALMPSFSTSGLPEYPATSTALYRPLPSLPPLVHHPPDPAGRVVGDVQGAVGARGHTHRPVLWTGAVLVPEAVRERLVRPDGLAVLERHKHDTIAGLGQGRAVPRAVKRHEGPVAKPRGELGAPIERESVRRPMPRKRDQRLLLVLAASDRLAVAPILGREHQVTQLGVVVAIRPAVVVPLRELEELFRRLFRALLQREQLGPVLAQLIAAVLGRVQLA